MLGAIGMAAGLLSGLLGIGGGILMVPAFSAGSGSRSRRRSHLARVRRHLRDPGHDHPRRAGRHRLDVRDPARDRRDPGRAGRRAVHDRGRRTRCATRSRSRSGSIAVIYAAGEILALAVSSPGRGRTPRRASAGEPAGERVLLARVEAAEHRARGRTAPRAGARTAAAARAARRRRVRAAPTTPPRSRTRRAPRSRGPGRAARARGEVRRGTRRVPRASACSRGGAQRTAARCTRRATRARRRATPTSAGSRSRTRCIDANRKSPERSPVNTRPVRFPPCAAGASPTISTRGARVAEPGHRPRPSTSRRGTTPASRARPPRATRRAAGTHGTPRSARARRDREHGRGTVGILRRVGRYPARRARPAPRQLDGVVGDAPQACEDPKMLGEAARRGGRGDVAARARDPLARGAAAATTSTSSRCSPVTAP